jgi:hypothetical protein
VSDVVDGVEFEQERNLIVAEHKRKIEKLQEKIEVQSKKIHKSIKHFFEEISGQQEGTGTGTMTCFE